MATFPWKQEDTIKDLRWQLQLVTAERDQYYKEMVAYCMGLTSLHDGMRTRLSDRLFTLKRADRFGENVVSVCEDVIEEACKMVLETTNKAINRTMDSGFPNNC